jgi:DNA topoisomerase-1
LFIGHPGQPLRGKIKARVRPEDITINISGPPPKCRQYDTNGLVNSKDNRGNPCKWGKVVKNPTVTWIATWNQPVTGDNQYISLGKTGVHGCSRDMAKFEKARMLAQNINKIRKTYTAQLDSTNTKTKQLACAVYLLDVLAIRPGTEKDEETEANTVGLTTLKCENLKCLPNNVIELNFLGKSSIQFVKKFKINEKVNITNKIVIIDDVTTTGSTLNEAKKCLVEAGYKNITTLTLTH